MKKPKAKKIHQFTHMLRILDMLTVFKRWLKSRKIMQSVFGELFEWMCDLQVYHHHRRRLLLWIKMKRKTLNFNFIIRCTNANIKVKYRSRDMSHKRWSRRYSLKHHMECIIIMLNKLMSSTLLDIYWCYQHHIIYWAIHKRALICLSSLHIFCQLKR